MGDVYTCHGFLQRTCEFEKANSKTNFHKLTEQIKSCATKPKKVREISLRFKAPNTIPTHFHSFKSIIIIQSIIPLSYWK